MLLSLSNIYFKLDKQLCFLCVATSMKSLRVLFSEMRNSYVVTMMDAEQYMAFIQGLSDMGAAMRNVMASMLTNTAVYKKLTQGTHRLICVILYLNTCCV